MRKRPLWKYLQLWTPTLMLTILFLTLTSCTPVYASGVSGTGDIGAKSATAITDPTADASVIAALKGLLKQLQGTGTGNAPVRLVPRTTQISTDQTVAWAASAAINTQKNIDFALPASPCNIYQAICLNPSRVSDITVDVKVTEPTFNGETRRINLTSFDVAKATALQLFNDETAPFVTAQGANVTCSTDAVTYKVSTKSAKLAVGANATTGLLASVATTGTYNLSIYSHLWFWVYSSIALNAGDLTMSVDNTAACASPIETISIPAIAATTWTKLYIPMVDPTLCTAIVSMGVNMAVDKGAFDIYFDDVSAFKPGSESPLIEGLHNGVGSRFSTYNTTALGATDDFSFYLRLKEYR